MIEILPRSPPQRCISNAEKTGLAYIERAMDRRPLHPRTTILDVT
jgi:hypothetical protein